MPSKKEKWLEFHDRQYQFKFPLLLYADFESILKRIDEQYNKKMIKMKTNRRGKTTYTEKTNTHVPSGWCVHNAFAFGCIPDPLKL